MKALEFCWCFRLIVIQQSSAALGRDCELDRLLSKGVAVLGITSGLANAIFAAIKLSVTELCIMSNNNSMSDTATAHLEWDQRWQTETGRADWLVPDDDVIQAAILLKFGKNSKVLDLGCGVGRHAIFLAELGCETFALDGSSAGLAYAQKSAADRNLVIDFINGSIQELPYETNFFDYVLSFNVIYHGDEAVVRQCLKEIHRILRPGGFFQGTLLSKRNGKYGKGTEISPNTFVIENDGDKNHPHFYCNAQELCQLLAGFEISSLIDKTHEKPESWHWHLIAERN